jgi:hypothetical protein
MSIVQNPDAHLPFGKGKWPIVPIFVAYSNILLLLFFLKLEFLLLLLLLLLFLKLESYFVVV